MRCGWGVALVLFASMMAAGCTTLSPPAADAPGALEALDAAGSDGEGARGPGEGAAGRAHEPASMATSRPPPLRVDALPAWAKPRNLIELQASHVAELDEGAREASWHWFVGTNGSDVRIRNASGTFYLQGGTGEGTPHHEPPPVARGLDTGLVPPGAASVTIEFPEPARYAFATPRHPDVRFLLTVVPEDAARRVEVEVAVVEHGQGVRFVPDEALVGEGSTVRFVNRDVVAHAVVEARYWAHVPWRAPMLGVVGVDTGWYEAVALATARDGGAQGAPANPAPISRGHAGLLVDFESPPHGALVGPFAGRLSAAPDADARSYPFTASQDVRTLDLDVQLRAPTGAIAGELHRPVLEVTLRAHGTDDSPGEPLERFRVTDDGRFRVEDLPAGSYRVGARLAEGAVADFELLLALRYDVRPPPLPAWMHAAAGAERPP